MLYQKFQSPALAGFAILSHWLPFLMFSVAAGALADRFDPRRIIQCGMGLFIIASLGWGYFFITGTLEVWHAMVLLVIHGCAGVLWQTPNQLLLYDIVGPADLISAVRLNATARYVGVLVGPAMGGVIMLALGPSYGILLNTVFYLPLVLWLVNAPYGPRFRKGAPAPHRAVRGFADILHAIREVARHPVIVSMTLLAGCSSFLVGNAYNAQMPGFANDLGHGDPGVSYSLLLAADAAGAMVAGIALEGSGLLPPKARTALILAILWCGALMGFALASSYPVALALLFAAGFFELSFNAMAQTLVQVHAPADMRGRVIGLFNMASLGLRAFSGVSVGLIGSLIGVHWSLALSAMVMMAIACGLLALP
jgi:MFS family permease